VKYFPVHVVNASEFALVCFSIEFRQFLVRLILFFGKFIPVLFLQDVMRIDISNMESYINSVTKQRNAQALH
jgi:hypothetical protein